MKDIQNQFDDRKIAIKKVGVKTISYPIVLRDREDTYQHTVASVNMYVNLPHHFKGTHMSRFVEILNTYHGEINLINFQQILKRMKEKLEAEASHLEISFPFFIKNTSGRAGFGDRCYLCKMHGSLAVDENLVLELQVPFGERDHQTSHQNVTTQGNAKIIVEFDHFIWIEDLVKIVENAIETGLKCKKTDGESNNCIENITKKIYKTLLNESAVKRFKVVIEKTGSEYTSFVSTEI